MISPIAPVQRARDPAKYLGQLLATMSTQEIGPPHVVYVLKTIGRELLPAVAGAEKCPQSRLFTDWCLHNRIDRSPVGRAALAAIAEALPRHGSEGCDNKWLEEQISGAVSFSALRLELLAACRLYGLSDELFASWERWQQFAIPLAFELSDRPILLGAGGRGHQDAMLRIDAAPLRPQHRPAELAIVLDDRIKPWWRIRLAGDAAILVQVLLGGFQLSDFPTPKGWMSPLDSG